MIWIRVVVEEGERVKCGWIWGVGEGIVNGIFSRLVGGFVRERKVVMMILFC